MATPVVAPQLGLVEEIVVLEWLVADGDRVTAGQPVVVVETEKTQTELEAPADGMLRIAVPAGEEPLPADTVLGYVD